MPDIILLNKPHNVLSQFSDTEGRSTLADFLQAPGFRAAGRLDYDSEGLLLLTDDGRLQQQVANPRHKLWKTYWVQVEGNITDVALQQLVCGVKLRDGVTAPARAKHLASPTLWDRDPPVRVRLSVPDSWLELSIREGRNRQVRRMTAAIGFPTLRLVRVGIGQWTLDGMQPGEHQKQSVNMPASDAPKPRGKPKPRRRRS